MRIAALVDVDEPEDAWLRQHLTSCDACAAVYLEHVLIAGTARDLARADRGDIDATTPPGHRVRLPAPRLPLIAATLLIATALATATVVLSRQTRFLGAPGLSVGRVGEIAAQSRIDFAAAGLAPDDVIRDWCSFVTGDGGPGTIVVAATGVEARHDVLAFGPDGVLLWRASASPTWRDLGGAARLTMLRLSMVVTSRDGDACVETACVVMGGASRTAVFLLRTEDGAVRGSLFYRGEMVVDDAREPVVPLPPDGRNERRLLLLSQHGFGPDRAAAAVVFSTSGEQLQHVILPSIGISGTSGPTATRCEVDWSEGHEQVTIETSDRLHFVFPVERGLLDVGRVRVAEPDDLPARFNEVRKDPEAYRKWLTGGGGRTARFRQLAESVELRTDPPPRGWWDR